MAGLDIRNFKTGTFQASPLAPVDSSGGWTGTFPGRADYPIRVDAAWSRGRPVYFKISEAATDAAKPGSSNSASEFVNTAIWISAIFMLFLVAPLFAWRNLRLGRGDRQGAIRLAGFAFVADVARWLLGAHHVPTIWEVIILGAAIANALFSAPSYGSRIWRSNQPSPALAAHPDHLDARCQDDGATRWSDAIF